MDVFRLVFWRFLNRIPGPVRRMLLSARRVLQKGVVIPLLKVKYSGNQHYCPVCRSGISMFKDFGKPPRPNAHCPICKLLERHRLDWLFFQRKTNLFNRLPKRMLHVAPEEAFKLKFADIAHLDYITADLRHPEMVRMDITAIPCPDDCFDMVYCSHVLEHVPDDRKAIREFYRVLKPDGWALLQVPVTSEKTFEDPTIMDPSVRERLFGYCDHVRCCGPDYKDRLEEAGFRTTVFTATDIVDDKEDLLRMGIQRGRIIFYCEK